MSNSFRINMQLKSNLFSGDSTLEACAVSHASHIVPGTSGAHVRKIQAALIVLDDAAIAEVEILANHFGPSTAAAVLAYKTRRNIVNRSYQSQADNIVGIITIKALDDELFSQQVEVGPVSRRRCNRMCGCVPIASRVGLLTSLQDTAKRSDRDDVRAAMLRA
jgi:hypothetical protein